MGTTTDSYELQFDRRLRAVADLIAVGRSAEGSLAHFVFGIADPGTSVPLGCQRRRIPGSSAAGGPGRPRPGGGQLDTVVTIRPTGAAHGKGVPGRAGRAHSAAGRWSYRAALQQGDSAGVVLPRDSVRVSRHADGASLALSDIALGTPGQAVPWVTEAADTVLLAPSALFRKGDEVEIYYEASGASTGQPYRHEITVLRAETEAAPKAALVSLSFDEEAPGEVIRSRRMVRLDRLKPGDYMVEVKVTAPDGSSQVRRRAIRLTKARLSRSTPTRSSPAVSSSRRTPPD